MAVKKVKISFHTREEVVNTIQRLAQERGVPKSRIIEDAVEAYNRSETWEGSKQAHGAWKREESPEETVKNARNLLNEAMLKHQR